MPPVPQSQGHPGGQTVWNKRKTNALLLNFWTCTDSACFIVQMGAMMGGSMRS